MYIGAILRRINVWKIAVVIALYVTLTYTDSNSNVPLVRLGCHGYSCVIAAMNHISSNHLTRGPLLLLQVT